MERLYHDPGSSTVFLHCGRSLILLANEEVPPCWGSSLMHHARYKRESHDDSHIQSLGPRLCCRFLLFARADVDADPTGVFRDDDLEASLHGMLLFSVVDLGCRT